MKPLYLRVVVLFAMAFTVGSILSCRAVTAPAAYPANHPSLHGIRYFEPWYMSSCNGVGCHQLPAYKPPTRQEFRRKHFRIRGMVHHLRKGKTQ